MLGLVIILFPKANANIDMTAIDTHALLESKWWNISDDTGFNYHCEWHGISCNHIGNVISINQPRIHSHQPRLTDLNFTALQNLKYLSLSRSSITGTTFFQIGDLHLFILITNLIYKCIK